jgi:hypothetical protein
MNMVVVEGEVYAHVARGLAFDGRFLTLVDLSPSTISWSALTTSGLGYLPTGAFLDLWQHTHGPAREVRSVKGTLSLLDPDAQLAGHAILELSNPRMTVLGLTYDVGAVEGLVPTSSGACVLFLEWERARTPPEEPAPAMPEPQEESDQ